jgi:uncharacterized protein (TIGR00369 family)
MEPRTHLGADRRLCGTVLDLGAGSAQVALQAVSEMAVDPEGLVHGGFIFGLADYAAMLAVNDPHVVLAAAEARFLKPVRLGDRVLAIAKTIGAKGRQQEVRVEATVNSHKVFEGIFTCIVLERHVLERDGST